MGPRDFYVSDVEATRAARRGRATRDLRLADALWPGLLSGAERTRTADIYVVNAALYRTELHPGEPEMVVGPRESQIPSGFLRGSPPPTLRSRRVGGQIVTQREVSDGHHRAVSASNGADSGVRLDRVPRELTCEAKAFLDRDGQGRRGPVTADGPASSVEALWGGMIW
jgi:hypothetical protein